MADQSSLDQLRVRNGDTVTASGTVVAAPGRPVRFCAPAGVARRGRLQPEQPPDCSFGVDLIGADLDRLTEAKTYQDTRWGRAAITGRYADGTVTVTAQGSPVTRPRPPSSLPDGTPCPAPAGGWDPGPVDEAGLEALTALVASRPDAYGEVVMTYPDGPGMLDSGATEVLMVTTTLPVATAEAELRARFTGNLCVRPAVRSRADVDAFWTRIRPDDDPGPWERHRAYLGHADYVAGRIHLALVVLDDAAYAWLSDAAPILDADPWLRPAR